MRQFTFHVLALVVALCTINSLTAAGKGGGKGLGQAVSNAGGNGAATHGLNKAGQKLTRVPPGLGHATALGHAKGAPAGAQGNSTTDGAGTTPVDAGSVPSDPVHHQKQLVIEQRNRDQRLIQAQKLRELAARNGDAELAANADRMEAFAQQHYQDRVAHLGRFGVTDPSLVTTPTTTDPTSGQPTTTTPNTVQPAAATTTTTTSVASPTTTPWWKPKWMFGAAK